MSERDWYKSTPASSTVLIFGEVFPDRSPNTVSILFGQQAYETYQTKVYVEHLLMTRHHESYVDWSPLFCSLYAGIVAIGASRVVEIGSTLFATIDKLEKLQRLSHGPAVHDLEYLGVEPSPLFSQLAEALHPTAKIHHVTDLAQVVAAPGRSVSRCYQATSYALDTTAQLVNHCAESAFGTHGIWFSHDGTTRVVTILGKRLTLFGLPEFLSGMAARGYAVEFIQATHSAYAHEFEYLETWLIYHRFSAEEDAVFRHWLTRLDEFNADGARLYPSFDLAPLQERASSAFNGLVDDVRILDFTSRQALEKLSEWKRAVEQP